MLVCFLLSFLFCCWRLEQSYIISPTGRTYFLMHGATNSFFFSSYHGDILYFSISSRRTSYLPAEYIFSIIYRHLISLGPISLRSDPTVTIFSISQHFHPSFYWFFRCLNNPTPRFLPFFWISIFPSPSLFRFCDSTFPPISRPLPIEVLKYEPWTIEPAINGPKKE